MMKLEEAKDPCLATVDGRVCNQPKIDEHFGELVCEFWGQTENIMWGNGFIVFVCFCTMA